MIHYFSISLSQVILSMALICVKDFINVVLRLMTGSPVYHYFQGILRNIPVLN